MTVAGEKSHVHIQINDENIKQKQPIYIKGVRRDQKEVLDTFFPYIWQYIIKNLTLHLKSMPLIHVYANNKKGGINKKKK